MKVFPLVLFFACVLYIAAESGEWENEELESVKMPAESFDRTGLSIEMSEFLDWAFENGIDFEVRYFALTTVVS